MSVQSTITDPARLAALRRYDILDTPTEAEFDDIAKLAAASFDAPIGIVNLIADVRQWFKAEVGIGVRELPLDVSICAHAIVQSDIMVIRDTLEDPRFACNPLVQVEGGLRFYAGAPLRTPDAQIIGTVCVLDRAPRPDGITDRQRLTLEVLARQVMTQLELRRVASIETLAHAMAQAAERRSRFILDAARLGSWEWMMLTGSFEASSAFKANFGVAIDQPFSYEQMLDAVHPQDRDRVVEAFQATITRGCECDVEFRLGHAEQGEVWLNLRAQLDRASDGSPFRLAGISLDISDRKNEEAQKQLLMEELAHRVKNTFSVVQAIASQTLRQADPEIARTFQSRLVALSHAHDMLLQKSWSSATVGSLLDSVLGLQAEAHRFNIAGPEVLFGPKAALSLALLAHEMATNSVKYGALSADGGSIEIRWTLADQVFQLTWRERGGPPAVQPEKRGFGSRLLRMGIAGSNRAEFSYEAGGLSAIFEADDERITR
ncbi:HWE histidine kinase domain-containing protein [Bosea sp. 124]|uniref:sensor histidine kinase n=1 Tax=Bosea sp. 124 TaxID=2135642 RepID=UPI000D344D86|nr:HWE histidine kinase domain-containing protein [Bosea sp. 124]PTM39557.1 two-component sensor histidine kinase [Bosea sp. 124]